MTIKAPRAPLQLTTIEDELDDVLAAACDRESLVLSRLDARGRCLSLPKMNSMRPAASRPTARSGTIFSIFAKTAATTEHAKQGRDLYMTGVVCGCDS
jgi:hypothetical protein